MATVDRITLSPPAALTPSGGPPAHPPGVSAPARPGWLAMLFLSALAFLLASFPARNSDLWQHLAAGRQLARGELSFGPSWLYDLLGYGLYSALGGPGLVFVKALLVVALALVLLRLSRSGPGWWVPAACTALALLAAGTRLLLQPVTVSYLFLALALWLLHPGTKAEGRSAEELPPPSGSGLLRLWPLLVLFVLWANVDGWFVLGLATVALTWLGRLLDIASRREGGQGNSVVLPTSYLVLSLALLAGACLLNPSGVGAFRLPQGLAWWGPAQQMTSPFQGAYFAGVGLSPAGLAYFPLLLLGLVSFVLNLPRWRWSRFLPWLGLALLSAVQARAIPFFAVVAGPALAWNLQEALADRSGAREDRLWRQGLVLGRALAVLAGLALLVCAWPGWLQATPAEAIKVGEPRRWAVETHPSLERGAEVTRRWHEQGKLGPDARGLHLSAEAASAFAWFCPEEKGVLDERLAAGVRGDPGAPDDWAGRMRSAGIHHVIVYDTDRYRFFATLGRLLEDERQWPLLYREGYLAVFGWRDPDAVGEEDPFRGLRLDLNSLAFHPAEDKKAPREPPPREPEARRWWDAFWTPVRPRPVDQEEATLHLFHAEAMRRGAPQRHSAAWERHHVASLVGAAACWAGPADLLDLRVRLAQLPSLLPERAPPGGLAIPERGALVLQQGYVLQQDDTPPALLYLAVRAARRAVAANPDDPQAHLVLGESYLRLLRATRERAWGAPDQLPKLAELRRAQASAALNQAIQLKPDFARAHLSLGGLYQEMGYLDLTLKHLRAHVNLARQQGLPPDLLADQFRNEVGWSPEDLGRLAQEVTRREDQYTVASAGRSVLDRALKARELGLRGKARDLLLASDISAFGPKGMALEVELLLRTGRPRDVRDWLEELSPGHKADLGSSYYWLRAQALAASGDYASAQEEFHQLSRSLSAGPRGQRSVQFREVMAVLVGRRVLEEQATGRTPPELLLRAFGRAEFRQRVARVAQGMKREAEVNVLRGLLALEEGDVEEAESAFREALSIWKDEATAASGGGLDFKGRPVAQACLGWLE
jgi:tetratricopeptide (TPR) repeat protein